MDHPIVIELSLSPNYVNDWTVSDAIREFMQNAIDSDDFIVTYKDSVLTISNSGNLKRETILLGSSSKTNDSQKVGQFGEGYKIGLLVLCRNGFKPFINIYSNFRMETWLAYIEHSEKFKSDLLKIEISENSHDSIKDKIDFIIPDFPADLYQDVIKNTLQLRVEKFSTIETKYGQILLDPEEKGRIYVNGLFICKSSNEKIGFGYNIKPEYLKVDRDRRLIADFNLFWMTSQMWANGNKESAVKNIIDNLPDVQYLIQSNSSSTNLELIAESTYTEIKKKYGEGVLIVKDQREFDQLVKSGNDPNEIKYVEENTYNIITSSSTYKKPELKIRKNSHDRNPLDVLSDLFDKWSSDGVDQDVLDDLEDVMEIAANWTVQVKTTLVNDDIPF